MQVNKANVMKHFGADERTAAKIEGLLRDKELDNEERARKANKILGTDKFFAPKRRKNIRFSK